jgi:hypothetical protein
MTPRDVDELTPGEYRALVSFANTRIRAENRAAKRRH